MRSDAGLQISVSSSFSELDKQVMMKTITILLAEDHHIVLEGIKMLLSFEEDLEVVGEAFEGHRAVELAVKLQPDVVVMDIAMPELNGLEATRQICQRTTSTKEIILSAHNDDAYVKKALAFGASGYLLKQNSGAVLPRAIREVHQSTSCFSPDIFRRLVHHREKSRSPGDPVPKLGAPTLTSRETEVLQLIAEGATNKEAAATLGISIKTVEKHRHKLMQKLNIHHTAGLARHAIENGIVESSLQRTTERRS